MDLGGRGDRDGFEVELVELVGRLGPPRVAQRALDGAGGQRVACLACRCLELGGDLVTPRARDPLELDRAGDLGEHDPPARSRPREAQADLDQRVDPAQRVGGHRLGTVSDRSRRSRVPRHHLARDYDPPL